MKNKILILSLFLAIVMSGCIQKPVKPSNEQPENNNVVQKNDEEKSTSTEEADTSDWLTYRNEEYGIEFKYEPSLILKDFSKELSDNGWEWYINFGKEEMYIGWDKPSKMGVIKFGIRKGINKFNEKEIFWPMRSKNFNVEKIEIGKNKYSAYVVTDRYNSVEGNVDYLGYFVENNKLFEISYDRFKKEEVDENIFEEMVKTINFFK